MDDYMPVRCGWNYLSIPKLQQLHRQCLGMDKLFHPTFHNGCNYLSLLGFKFNLVSRRSHRRYVYEYAKSLRFNAHTGLVLQKYIHPYNQFVFDVMYRYALYNDIPTSIQSVWQYLKLFLYRSFKFHLSKLCQTQFSLPRETLVWGLYKQT